MKPDDGADDWLETFKAPRSPGLYIVRCGENDYTQSYVAIIRSKGGLRVHDQDVGVYPLNYYINGLTCPQFKKLA